MACLEELTITDRDKLDQLIELTSNLELDKGTLLRFLKARSYDVKQAEDMIRSSITWREEHEDVYFSNPCGCWQPAPEIPQGFTIYHCGKDFEGRPVFYTPMGNWPCGRDMYEKGLQADILKYAGISMDNVYKSLLPTKHQNFVSIVDNDGLGMRKLLYEIQSYDLMNDVIRMFRDYESAYPETLHKAFCINTPTVFYWGFNLVKPFLTKRMLERINFFPCNEAQWLPALHENLPLDAIPPKFGGTAVMRPIWPWPFESDGSVKSVVKMV